MPQVIPGHAIAAVRELKSSLWATAGGKAAEIRPKRFVQTHHIIRDFKTLSAVTGERHATLARVFIDMARVFIETQGCRLTQL